MASPTALYAVVPMSAVKDVGAPLLQQLGYRISTYVEGKQQPIIKIFIDGIGQSTVASNHYGGMRFFQICAIKVINKHDIKWIVKILIVPCK